MNFIAGFFRNRLGGLGVLCLGLGVASLASHDYLTRKQELGSGVLQQYEQALGSSRSFLTLLIHSLSQDAHFQETISSHYNNALEKTLLGKLRKGQVEHLEVFDEQCTSLASAYLHPFPSHGCPKAISDTHQKAEPRIKPGDNKHSILALMRPATLATGAKVWILAQVEIGEAWLGVYPKLKTNFEQLGIYLSQVAEQPSYVLEKREKNFTGEQVSTLWTTDRFLHTANQLTSIPLLKSAMFWPLCLLGLCLLITQWMIVKRRTYRQRKIWLLFAERVESLFTNEGLVLNYVPENDPNLSAVPGALQAMQRIQQRILASQDRIKQLVEEKNSMTETIASFAMQEEHWKKELAQMACYEGLALQVRGSALGLVEELAKEAEHNNELNAAVKDTMLGTCRSVMSLANTWTEQLNSQGSRKFIRSLCEQKNPDSEHSNLLEEQLAVLLKHLYSLVDQGIYLCTNLGEQEEKLNEKIGIVQRWHRLAQGEAPAKGVAGKVLQELCEQTLALRSKNPECVRFTAVDTQYFAEINEVPVPQVTLAAAFFHMIESIALTLPPTVRASEISVRTKEVNNEFFVLLSCADGNVYHDEQRRQEMWSSIAKVNLLVAPYGLSYTLLPSQHDLTVFALKWKSPHTQLPEFIPAAKNESVPLNRQSPFFASA